MSTEVRPERLEVPERREGRGPGAVSISSVAWGSAHGSCVELFTLTNSRGMSVKVSTYGGVVQSLWAPDRAGRLVNVVLGFPALDDYVRNFEGQLQPSPESPASTYFGALIGRCANRVAGARFSLGGQLYELAANEGAGSLHGGPGSYNTQIWSARPEIGTGFAALELSYTDPAGKNGFPGTVCNTVTYSLTNDNALRVTYHATTDVPTVVNLTNHTYFNLAGEGSGSALGQYLQINADTYQPTDEDLVPTGAFVPVAGTAFDFRALRPIGEHIERYDLPDGGGQPRPQLAIAQGYDHNWVLNGSGYRLVATAFDPGTGITLRTYTDQPGVQFYTGNFLAGNLTGTSGRRYRPGDGFTLETQHFPDSPHHIGQAGWPSVVLYPGEAFRSVTTYQFTAGEPGAGARSS